MRMRESERESERERERESSPLSWFITSVLIKCKDIVLISHSKS